MTSPCMPPGEKWSGERSRISWAYPPKRWKTNEIARSLFLRSTSLTTLKFLYLHSSIHTFFERVFRKILLGYTVTKVPASPRNSTWFTILFLLVRGWGLGTRLIPHSLTAWHSRQEPCIIRHPLLLSVASSPPPSPMSFPCPLLPPKSFTLGGEKGKDRHTTCRKTLHYWTSHTHSGYPYQQSNTYFESISLDGISYGFHRRSCSQSVKTVLRWKKIFVEIFLWTVEKSWNSQN